MKKTIKFILSKHVEVIELTVLGTLIGAFCLFIHLGVKEQTERRSKTNEIHSTVNAMNTSPHCHVCNPR